MRAYEKTGGTLAQKVTMYVDRQTCTLCNPSNPDSKGLKTLLKAMNVKELTVHFKNGESVTIFGN